MKTLPGIAVILIALGWPQAVLAQSVSPRNASMAVLITEARKANAALLRQYSWTSRTEIFEDGQVKDIRIEAVNYSPGGQLQRTLLNDQGASLPHGFLRRAIAEHERKKLEEYLTGLRDLLEQYALPTAGKVLDFMNQATTTGPDASGLLEMTGQNVVSPGDVFTAWTDARTHQTRKIHVGTFYQGDTVSVAASFHTIDRGPTHLAYAEVIVPAKGIRVQVQNFNYNRNN
jgi:hypothetical protein